MRILVSGSGGIGGNLGARLAHAGHDVTLVTANDRITAALRRDGARLSGVGVGTECPQTVAVQNVVTDAAGADGPFDLLLLASQSPALGAACEAALPKLSAEAVAVCFQNGLPEPHAQRVLGDRVLGCVVGWGGSMPEPGVYVRTSAGGFQLGEAGGGDSERVQRVAAVLRNAVPTDVTPNLPGVRWSKLAINSAITTIGACCGAPLGSLLTRRHLRRAFLEVISEATAVAAAEGVAMEPVNGTFDLTTLALTPNERRARLGSPSLFKKHSVVFAVGLKYRRMRSSMLYALERGRKPEVRWLNGAIVEVAQRRQLETPVNRALCDIVESIVAGDAVSSFDNLTPGVVGDLVDRARTLARAA